MTLEGGESTLVDDLLLRGYSNVSVLDISATAIDFTKRRLGSQAQSVHWHAGDIIHYDFGEQQFDLWHDRAVFHFLTEPDARRAYVDLVHRSIKPGGHVVMATFGPHGPLKCSGLDVVRYNEHRLHDEFGEGFHWLDSKLVNHPTPMGTNQEFLYSWCKVNS